MSQKSKVLLAFTGVFVAGAIAGGIMSLRIGVAQVEQRRSEALPKAVPVVTPDEFTVRQMKQFTDQLTLTTAQKEKILPLITSASEKLNKLRKENADATTAIVKDMYTEIAKDLTAEQSTKLTDLRKKFQAQVADRFNRQPPPGDHSGGPNRRGGPTGSLDGKAPSTSSTSSTSTNQGSPNLSPAPRGGNRPRSGGQFGPPPAGAQSGSSLAPAAPAPPASPATPPAA